MLPSPSRGATKHASSSARCVNPLCCFPSPLGGLSIHRQTISPFCMCSCRAHAGEVYAGQVLGKHRACRAQDSVIGRSGWCREVRLCPRISSVWQQPGRHLSLWCQIAQGTASHSARVQRTIFCVQYTWSRLLAAPLHLPCLGMHACLPSASSVLIHYVCLCSRQMAHGLQSLHIVPV